MREVLIEASWKKKLAREFSAEYMASLSLFLRNEKAAGKLIYPASGDIFAAFKLTPFDRVKVVILGQDPYHGPNQAHGRYSIRTQQQQIAWPTHCTHELQVLRGTPTGEGNVPQSDLCVLKWIIRGGWNK